jgi:hypothetical protein
MQYYGRIIFLIFLCMSLGACVALPTYSDPQLDAVDDSEIAILKSIPIGSGFVSIRDVEGNDIPIKSSELNPSWLVPDGQYLHYKDFRLTPGEYELRYRFGTRKIATVHGVSLIFLEAGHVYTVRSQHCYLFCFRMRSYSADVWLVDITTGEWIGGCRQGMGCVDS